jgi:hypothetical protein
MSKIHEKPHKDIDKDIDIDDEVLEKPRTIMKKMPMLKKIDISEQIRANMYELPIDFVDETGQQWKRYKELREEQKIVYGKNGEEIRINSSWVMVVRKKEIFEVMKSRKLAKEV